MSIGAGHKLSSMTAESSQGPFTLASELSYRLDEEDACREILRKASPAIVKTMALLWLSDQARLMARSRTAMEEKAAQERWQSEVLKPNPKARRVLADYARRKGLTGTDDEVIKQDIEIGNAKRKAEAELRRAREAEEDEEMWRKRQERVERAVRRWEEELRVKWTEDLLNSEIALPDGTRTTWGDATLSQHVERREMFIKNAVANTEGAARHEQAIKTLNRTGATSLREALKSANQT